MCGCRTLLLAGALLGLTGPVAAETVPPGRMAYLAAEAARLSDEAATAGLDVPEVPTGQAETAELATGEESAGPRPQPIQIRGPRPRSGFANVAWAPDWFAFAQHWPVGPGPTTLLLVGSFLLALTWITRVRLRRRRPAKASSPAPDHELREVTWRFRSPEPVRIGHESSDRFQAVLDEIEILGRQLRQATSAGGHSAPAPVVFTRRDRESIGGETSPPAVPAVSAPRPTPTVEAAPTATIAPPTSREERYALARRLLAEGAERDAIRAATGLKTAELDLIRCGLARTETPETIRAGRARLNVSWPPQGAAGRNE
ncbi:MAG: hypothetical protein KC591_14330 [Gemmatimonadetes bacterium]|nr:hypothetical protein [Gemmatimonadota bacterium]